MRERAKPVADGREEARGPHGLDRMARLAARLLSAPAAIGSLIDGERAVHAGGFGLPEPAASSRSTPLSDSLCPRVGGGEPWIVEDARREPGAEHGALLAALGAASCAAFPVTAADGSVVGALCVLDRDPRRWTEAELGALADLAAAAGEELSLAQTVRAHTEVVDLLQSTLRTRERDMATAAHDLRSPLHGALLVLQILETQGPTAESNGVLGRALRSMNEIIGKRLGASARKRQDLLTPCEVDAGELVARVQGVFAARAATLGKELAAELEAGLPGVWADPARLEQVLSSLVACALCRAGAGRLELAVRGDGEVVRFEVRAAGGDPLELDCDASGSLVWSLARTVVLAHGGEAGVAAGSYWFTLPQALPGLEGPT